MTVGHRIGVIGVVLLVSIAWGVPAHAMQCSEWKVLTAENRGPALKDLIRDLLDDPKIAQWTSINKGRIEQCLLQYARNLEVDFDDACSKGASTPINVFDDILVHQARSCAQLVR